MTAESSFNQPSIINFDDDVKCEGLSPQSENNPNSYAESHKSTLKFVYIKKKLRDFKPFDAKNEEKNLFLRGITSGLKNVKNISSRDKYNMSSIKECSELYDSMDDLTNLSWLQDVNLLKNIQKKPFNCSTKLNSCNSQCTFDKISIKNQVHPNQDKHLNISSKLQDIVKGNDDVSFYNNENKPPYSFSILIFMAIESSPNKKSLVKEIYDWILERFPYFRMTNPGWKNSVRHNLSLNKCFKKFNSTGKCSYWYVDPVYKPLLLKTVKKLPYYPYKQIQMTSSFCEFLNSDADLNFIETDNRIYDENKKNKFSDIVEYDAASTLANLSNMIGQIESAGNHLHTNAGLNISSSICDNNNDSVRVQYENKNVQIGNEFEEKVKIEKNVVMEEKEIYLNTECQIDCINTVECEFYKTEDKQTSYKEIMTSADENVSKRRSRRIILNAQKMKPKHSWENKFTQLEKSTTLSRNESFRRIKCGKRIFDGDDNYSTINHSNNRHKNNAQICANKNNSNIDDNKNNDKFHDKKLTRNNFYKNYKENNRKSLFNNNNNNNNNEENQNVNNKRKYKINGEDSHSGSFPILAQIVLEEQKRLESVDALLGLADNIVINTS